MKLEKKLINGRMRLPNSNEEYARGSRLGANLFSVGLVVNKVTKWRIHVYQGNGQKLKDGGKIESLQISMAWKDSAPKLLSGEEHLYGNVLQGIFTSNIWFLLLDRSILKTDMKLV